MMFLLLQETRDSQTFLSLRREKMISSLLPILSAKDFSSSTVLSATPEPQNNIARLFPSARNRGYFLITSVNAKFLQSLSGYPELNEGDDLLGIPAKCRKKLQNCRDLSLSVKKASNTPALYLSLQPLQKKKKL